MNYLLKRYLNIDSMHIKETLIQLFCRHSWEFVTDDYVFDPETGDTITNQLKICSKCGKIKKLKTY